MSKQEPAFVYGPFPPGVRADENGMFYEEILPDGASKYVIVRAVRYMDERARELMENGISLDDLYPEVAVLGREPRENALWLYKVESFTVDRQYHEDQEVFSDHAENYVYNVFDDYHEMMDFCLKNHGIDQGNFKKKWETNYPEF
ncbi:hypothetical protein [Burkholderia sp. ABCPW 14]|uniref:hypothetical protein n=1 Tax=Burkholderia sp. ABCPW 14 TaxID=1637860 RepID=UPI0012E3743A|nr:hypothetical protein [Burkholderia sp. ABCPW 14]